MTVSESLRALATFLEEHPEIDMDGQNITLLKYCMERDEVATIARAGSWQKVYTDRAQVCRRVVVGKRTVPAVPAQPAHEEDIVEWVCEDEPLLKAEATA